MAKCSAVLYSCRIVIRYHARMPPAKTTAAPRATRKKQTTLDAAPTTRVLRQFRVVFNAVKTHFRQVEKEAGVGGAQLWALSVIRSNPGIGMNDLAHAMDVQEVSMQIARQVQNGLRVRTGGGR